MKWPWVSRKKYLLLSDSLACLKLERDLMEIDLRNAKAESAHWKREWASALLTSTATMFAAQKGK